MYTVELDGQLLYDPRVDELVILNDKLELEDNHAGGFDFTLPAGHPLFNDLQKHKSRIELFQDNRLIFRGRITNDEMDFQNFKQVECEGVLGFFNDSVLPPYTYEGGVRPYIELLVDMHNERMGDHDHKKFTVGNVTVTDPNDFIVRGNSAYPTAWEEINDKLIDLLGGHIMLRIEGDTQYIDYLSDSQYLSQQAIEFGENLLDIRRFTQGDEVANAIIPIGAAIESEDEEEEERRLTIESVNDGKDYVYDPEAVQIYGGFIFKKVEYQDVTLPENLIQRGYSDLAAAINLGLTIELTAVDMSMLNIDIDSFRIFDYVRVLSNPHNLESLFLVRKMVIHLTDPAQNTLTVGKDLSYLTTEQAGTNKRVNQVRQEVEEVRGVERNLVRNTNAIGESVTQINDRTDNYWQVNHNGGGTPNMVAGHKQNYVSTNVQGATVGGGGDSEGNSNDIYQDFTTVNGGRNNKGYGTKSTIGGGESNIVYGEGATVGGGRFNGVYDSHAAILGGFDNIAYAPFSLIAGGQNNVVSANYAAIVGGKDNLAPSYQAAIFNGEENSAVSDNALVGNGKNNSANGNQSTVLNGQNNQANSRNTTVLNGENNRANTDYGTVLGGRNNSVNGQSGSVLSGEDNQVNANHAAALGRGASANYEGSVAHANGRFNGSGAAQTQKIVLNRKTTTNTPTILGLSNSNDTIRRTAGYLGVHDFEYTIMAQSETGVAKVWKIEVTLADLGSGWVLLRNPDIKVLGQSVSAETWSVDFKIVSDGDPQFEMKRAVVEVTGSNQPIYWMGNVNITELVPADGIGIDDSVDL